MFPHPLIFVSQPRRTSTGPNSRDLRTSRHTVPWPWSRHHLFLCRHRSTLVAAGSTCPEAAGSSHPVEADRNSLVVAEGRSSPDLVARASRRRSRELHRAAGRIAVDKLGRRRSGLVLPGSQVVESLEVPARSNQYLKRKIEYNRSGVRISGPLQELSGVDLESEVSGKRLVLVRLVSRVSAQDVRVRSDRSRY